MQKKIMIKPANQVREAQTFIDECVNKPVTVLKLNGKNSPKRPQRRL